MSEVGGSRSQSVAEAGRGATRGGQGGHLESLMFGLAAVHPQSSSAAHLQTARRRDGARRGALGHREDLADGSVVRRCVAVLDGDAAHLGFVLDCDLDVWEKCGSRERWDSVRCRESRSSTRREQNMWRSPRCSCEGSQRCTRSRPAQRTCRPLAVGAAPNPSGSLAVKAGGNGASLIAAAKLLLGEVAVTWLDLEVASAN